VAPSSEFFSHAQSTKVETSGCFSADSLPSSWCLLSWRNEEINWQSMAETQSFNDKSVGEWLRRLECASLLYRYSL